MTVRLSIVVTSLTLALAGASSAQPSGMRPVVRAVRGPTAGVQGTGFKAHEHVVVALFVLAHARETRRAVANLQGSFVVRFAYELPACTPWQARAVGPLSGRVWYRSPVRECSPK